MKRCKECGIEYEDNKTFCKECGSKLSVKSSVKYCEDCGIEYEVGKKFCKECGATLKNKDISGEETAEKEEVKNAEDTPTVKKKEKHTKLSEEEKDISVDKSKKGNSLIFIGLIVVVAIAAVLIYMFAFNSPKEKIEAFSQSILSDNGNSIKKINSYIYIEPNTGMKFVEVKGGKYIQGDTPGNFVIGKSPKSVNTFWIGMYEVTEKNWMDVLPDWRKNYNKDNYPIKNQTWDEIQLFISELNKLTGRNFRLPKEAEWEYAARSRGFKYDYPNGENDITCSEACFGGGNECIREDKYGPEPVGSYDPINLFHIYDMAGNVAELCDNDFTANGKVKVTRGGSYLSPKKECSVFWLGHIALSEMKTSPGYEVGFRLVLDEPNLRKEIPIESRREVIRR